MWPGKGASTRDAVLYVCLGAKVVEAAIHANGSWLAKSSICVAVDRVHAPDRPLSALLEAMINLRKALGEQNASGVAVSEVRVLVADRWLSMLSLPWTQSLRSSASAQPYARSQMLLAGFDPSVNDLIRFDDAPYGDPRLAVAYPQALLASLKSLAQEASAPLTSVVPLSVAAWSWRRSSGSEVLGVVMDGLAQVIQGHRRITDVHVRSQSFEDHTPANTLKLLWRRVRLRDAALSTTPSLPVVDLLGCVAKSDKEFAPQAIPKGPAAPQIPRSLRLALLSSTRRSALDAVQTQTPMRSTQKLAVAAALTLVGLMTMQAWKAAQLAGGAKSQLVLSRTPTVVPQTQAWRQEDTAKAKAVNLAVRELNLPISAILVALQPPRDLRAAVLSVDLSPIPRENETASSVKIVAEALTSADMLRYVAYLSTRKPLEGAVLLKHEISSETAVRPYRFTVEAAWKD